MFLSLQHPSFLKRNFLHSFQSQSPPHPDLIKSELAALAFDTLQQVFRKIDIDELFTAQPLPFLKDQEVFVVIDPAAGTPSSDYAVVILCRQCGIVTVCVCLRNQIRLVTLHHKVQHGLGRVEERSHELLPQVHEKTRQFRVVLV